MTPAKLDPAIFGVVHPDAANDAVPEPTVPFDRPAALNEWQGSAGSETSRPTRISADSDTPSNS